MAAWPARMIGMNDAELPIRTDVYEDTENTAPPDACE
jgi:hypothetical protein